MDRRRFTKEQSGSDSSNKMTAKINIEDLVNIEEYKLTEDISIQTLNFKFVLMEVPMDNLGTCSICLEEREMRQQLARMGCGHFFHKTCLGQWIEITTTCPLCRTDAVKKD